MNKIEIINLSAPPLDKKEILRYAKTPVINAEISSLLEEVIAECQKETEYKVCYTVLPCDSEFLRGMDSENLSKNLVGSKAVCVFAATLGVGIDRIINKYSRISPAKALIADAFASERIEALCDKFTKNFKGEISPRFSAGYGDLPLALQKEIFRALSPEKHIGACLGESLIASPAKTVTAIVGIGKNN